MKDKTLNLLATKDDKLYLATFSPDYNIGVVDTATHHYGGTHVLTAPSQLCYYTLATVYPNDLKHVGHFLYMPPYSSPYREGDAESRDWLVYLSHLLMGYNFDGVDFLMNNLSNYELDIKKKLIDRFILTEDKDIVDKLRVVLELTS